MFGTLQKKGDAGLINLWKTRVFVLEGGVLRWYDGRSNKGHLAVADITSVQPNTKDGR